MVRVEGIYLEICQNDWQNWLQKIWRIWGRSESEDINEQERCIGTRMNKNLKVLSLDENFITAYVYAIEKEKFDLAVSAKAEIQITDVWKLIKERLSDSMNMSCKLKKAEEITVEGFRSIIVEGDSNNLLRSERRILQKKLWMEYYL